MTSLATKLNRIINQVVDLGPSESELLGMADSWQRVHFTPIYSALPIEREPRTSV